MDIICSGIAQVLELGGTVDLPWPILLFWIIISDYVNYPTLKDGACLYAKSHEA
jgi:hypothetical protein